MAAPLPRAGLASPSLAVGGTPSPDRTSAMAPGLALAAVGRQIGRQAEQMGAVAVEKNRQQERTAYALEMARLRADMTRDYITAQQEVEPGAPQFTERFLSVFDDRAEAALKDAPDWLQDELLVDTVSLRGDFESRALVFEAEQRVAAKLGRLDEATALYANTVRTDPGQYEAADAALAAAVDGAGLPAAAAEEALRIGRETIATSYLRAVNEADPEGAKDVIADFDWLDPRTIEGLLADNRAELNRLEAERRAAEAEARARRAEAAQAIEGTMDLLRGGYTVAPERLAAARETAAPYPELDAQLNRAVELAGFGDTLARSDPFAVQATVQGLEARLAAEGATEDLVAALDIARGVQGRQERGLKDDPLGYAASTGVVALEPFDPSSPDSWRARAGAAEVVRATYGVTAAPVTALELGRMTDAWQAAGPAQQLATVDALVAAPLAPDVRADLLDRISGADPMMGLVASWAETGDPALRQTAERMLAGRAALASNPDLKPSTTERDGVLESALEGALVLDVTGAWRSVIVEGADALYVQALGGRTPAAFDSDLYERAVEQVTGGLTEVNGRVTFLPPGMDERTFEAWWDGLTDADLQGPEGATPMGPHVVTADGVRPLTAAEVRDDWQLLPAGPGEYVLGVTIGDSVELAVTPSGGAYVLRAP